ncbi:MAG TPA: hypothetical protein VHE33_17355, partial [Acidobacteriaceae bacterium]|nr:hypothetical protein [Acidobacteriaceae bacterium]
MPVEPDEMPDVLEELELDPAFGDDGEPRLKPPDEPLDPAARKRELDAALGELDRLIGLDCIKQEVKELTNFLKVQSERVRRGLPQTKVS